MNGSVESQSMNLWVEVTKSFETMKEWPRTFVDVVAVDNGPKVVDDGALDVSPPISERHCWKPPSTRRQHKVRESRPGSPRQTPLRQLIDICPGNGQKKQGRKGYLENLIIDKLFRIGRILVLRTE
jgi:hypothetical protein